MTVLLDKALSEISELTPEQQDSIAGIILDELEDEEKWEKAFANSQHELSQLARKIRADMVTGKVWKAEIDEL